MSSKSKTAGNLVALGSAAVVAVYGAGFMRTAGAAERFAEQSDERVLAPEDAAAAQAALKSAPAMSGAADSKVSSHITRSADATTNNAPVADERKADATIAKINAKIQNAATPASSRDVSVPVPPEVTTGNSSSAAAHVAVTAPTPVTSTPAAPAAVTKTATKKPSTPAAVPTTAATAIAPVAAPSVAATVPSPAVASPVAPPVTAPVAATTSDGSVANTTTAKLKDGEYTGYGTSRHGDVEVYLETTDGKITYVKISQCLTQYSCSWISDLPKQVLARQSARVDGVSGATQSANAFYYAVVQALAKAK